MLRSHILAVALALPSCGPTAPHTFELVDSLGVPFAIDDDGEWRYSDEPVPPCEQGNPGWGGIYGRFVYLCSACYEPDEETFRFDALTDCRVAVCEIDDECPELDGRTYACVAGLCQAPAQYDSEEVSLITAEALCAATIPRGEDANDELEARLAALTCEDDQCALPLPAGCMQPAP